MDTVTTFKYDIVFSAMQNVKVFWVFQVFTVAVDVNTTDGKAVPDTVS